MSLEIEVNLTAYPKGAELAINGLGRVENGKTVTIDEEQEAAFVAEHGKTVRDAFEGQEGITVKGRATQSVDEPSEAKEE